MRADAAGCMHMWGGKAAFRTQQNLLILTRA